MAPNTDAMTEAESHGLETREVNGHTQYTIDSCGRWSWSLYVCPTDDADHRGTVKAIKSVPYDGAIYKDNADRPTKARKSSTHRLHPSEVVSHYVEASDTDLTEAEVWARIEAAFSEAGVELPDRNDAASEVTA